MTTHMVGQFIVLFFFELVIIERFSRIGNLVGKRLQKEVDE